MARTNRHMCPQCRVPTVGRACIPPVVSYETDADEALGVVTSLRRARSPGSPWSSVAVLARTNAQLVLFERELEAAGVPFRSGGGRAFLARPGGPAGFRSPQWVVGSPQHSRMARRAGQPGSRARLGQWRRRARAARRPVGRQPLVKRHSSTTSWPSSPALAVEYVRY